MTTAVLGAVALTGASAAAEGAGAGARARAPAPSVRLSECSRGPEAADRRAVFRAGMRRVSGTRQMWIRFTLEERVGEGGFRPVKAPGLGVWRKSRPGVRRFAYRQRVLALAQGAAYRTAVSFRWYRGNGTVTRRARRRSRTCRQRGRLPNLRVEQIGGGNPLAGLPGAVGYAVDVVNDGPVGAGGFGVSLAVDGDTVDTQAVGGLAPGHLRRLSFTGPACAGTVTVHADPEDDLREAHESDNVLTSPCPSRP